MSQPMTVTDTLVLVFAGVGVLSSINYLYMYYTEGTAFPCYCQNCQATQPAPPAPTPEASEMGGGWTPTFTDPQSVWGPFTYFVALAIMLGFAFVAYWIQQQGQSTALYQSGQRYFQ